RSNTGLGGIVGLLQSASRFFVELSPDGFLLARRKQAALLLAVLKLPGAELTIGNGQPDPVILGFPFATEKRFINGARDPRDETAAGKDVSQLAAAQQLGS